MVAWELPPAQADTAVQWLLTAQHLHNSTRAHLHQQQQRQLLLLQGHRHPWAWGLCSARLSLASHPSCPPVDPSSSAAAAAAVAAVGQAQASLQAAVAAAAETRRAVVAAAAALLSARPPLLPLVAALASLQARLHLQVTEWDLAVVVAVAWPQEAALTRTTGTWLLRRLHLPQLLPLRKDLRLPLLLLLAEAANSWTLELAAAPAPALMQLLHS